MRSIGYDGAGNITSDNRLGSTYAYTYNDANRLKTVSYEGNLTFLRCRFTSSLVRPDGRARTIGARAGTYTYNGPHQLITRVVTNSGSANGTTHYVHDRSGNVIAELNASGASVREYIWLPETEIAPTAVSRAPIARPVAVVDGVGRDFFRSRRGSLALLAAPARARPGGRFALLLPRNASRLRGWCKPLAVSHQPVALGSTMAGTSRTADKAVRRRPRAAGR